MSLDNTTHRCAHLVLLRFGLTKDLRQYICRRFLRRPSIHDARCQSYFYFGDEKIGIVCEFNGGTARYTTLLRWDPETNVMEHGQWLSPKHRIHPEYCNMSPNAERFVFSATSSRMSHYGKERYSYAAISRMPYWTAEIAWDTMEPVGRDDWKVPRKSGGHFRSNEELALNSFELPPVLSGEVPAGLAVILKAEAGNFEMQGLNPAMSPRHNPRHCKNTKMHRCVAEWNGHTLWCHDCVIYMDGEPVYDLGGQWFRQVQPPY